MPEYHEAIHTAPSGDGRTAMTRASDTLAPVFYDAHARRAAERARDAEVRVRVAQARARVARALAAEGGSGYALIGDLADILALRPQAGGPP